MTGDKIQLFLAACFEFRLTIDKWLVHYQFIKEWQDNINMGKKIIPLEGALKKCYYNQRRLFSKPENPLNKAQLERKQKLVSVRDIYLESVNIDNEFVRDLQDIQSMKFKVH